MSNTTRTKRGIQDAPGREPSRTILTGDELLATGKANQHGGDVTVVHLPEIGIHGNTHFPCRT